jgi:hypothetical protein
MTELTRRSERENEENTLYAVRESLNDVDDICVGMPHLNRSAGILMW